MNVDRYVETISVSRWLAHNFPGAPEGDRHPKPVGIIIRQRMYRYTRGDVISTADKVWPTIVLLLVLATEF